MKNKLVEVKTKQIFVDFDCVLSDLQFVTRGYAKEKYNISLTDRDIVSWEFWGQYPKVFQCFSNLKLYSQAPIYTGAVEFMNNLYNLFGKENVFILTHSHSNLVDYKNELIKEVFNTDNVIHAKDKYLVTGDNVLIDDYLGNIEGHVNHNKGGFGIIFDKDGEFGWNKEPLEHRHDRVVRLETYEKIINKLTADMKGFS